MIISKDIIIQVISSRDIFYSMVSIDNNHEFDFEKLLTLDFKCSQQKSVLYEVILVN